MFSHRTAVPLAPNALALALEARPRPPAFDLTLSNPTRAGLAEVSAELGAALGRAALSPYDPSPRGHRPAREAVAACARGHGMPADPERLFLTAGTSEAYALLLQLLCDPGDAVLVPTPSYPLFEHLTAFEGVEAIPYPLAWDGRWHVDAGALRRARTPRCRAVVAVHPNNPTGSLATADDHAALAALGLPLLSDEVFGPFPLAPRAGALPSLLGRDGPPLTFALGGLSKGAGQPGLKCGWIALDGHPALVAEAAARLELLCDTRLTVGMPVQLALPEILRHGEATRAAIAARVRRNYEALPGLLGPDSPVERLPAEGGWSVVLRLPAAHEGEAFALSLLRDDDVLVHPGHFFDLPFAASAVVSLLAPEAVFDEAVRRLDRRARSPA